MLGIRRGNAFAHITPHHGAAKGGAGRRGEAAAKANSWEHPVLTTVASKGEGISQLVAALDRHHDYLASSGKLEERRKRRLAARTAASAPSTMSAGCAAPRNLRRRAVSAKTSGCAIKSRVTIWFALTTLWRASVAASALRYRVLNPWCLSDGSILGFIGQLTDYCCFTVIENSLQTNLFQRFGGT